MERSELQVVLGATGGAGSAIVEALAARGARVRAVSRAGDAAVPEGVERFAADVATPEGARRAVEGAVVVYHAVQPDYVHWKDQFPPMNRAIVDATAQAGAKLVFVDNLYMYDPTQGPITEATPETRSTPTCRLRHEMGQELLAAHRAGTLRVTIGRASDYYGPGAVNATLGERMFGQLLAGKKTQWMGRLDQPHTVNYLPDLGRAFATLGEHDGADGRVWILPGGDPLTGADFLASAIAAAGTGATPGVVSPGMMKVAGLFVPFLRAYGEMLYQWTGPFTTDARAFEEAFGPFALTPADEAMAETVAWFRAREDRVKAA